MPSKPDRPRGRRERIPPGATQQASDRTARPGADGATPLDDRHAAGTPAGGTEFGGMAGSNVDAGEPLEGDLAEAAATGAHPPEADDTDE